MKFDHNGVIDLRKPTKYIGNSRSYPRNMLNNEAIVVFNPYTSGFVDGNGPISAEIKYVKYLTTDMIGSINVGYNNLYNYSTLKIVLTNNAYLDNLEHNDTYKLSIPTRKAIGIKMFGKMFEKLTKFSNSKDYLNALYNLFCIPDQMPNNLSLQITMNFVLLFNKFEKTFQFDLNYTPQNHNYTNYNVIAYSENVDKLIKLKRVLETLQANTYSAKEVVDMIIKAEKY